MPIHGAGFQPHQGSNFNRVLSRDPALFGAQKPKRWHGLTDETFIDSMREHVRRFSELSLTVWATEVDAAIRAGFLA